MNAPPAPAPDPAERCATLRLESGALVVYDRQNHRAWLQTDAPVSLADAR